MFKYVIVVVLVAATAAGAARFSYGVGVSLYRPPEDNASWAPLINGYVTYWWAPQVNSTLLVGYSWYNADIGNRTDVKFNYMPITLYTAYHFVRNKQLDPFAGMGVVYSRKWWDGGKDDNVGFAGLVGVNYYPSEHFGAGVAFEYVVPDAGDFDSAYPAITFNIGGVSF
ncbi:MAG: hypothetical protein JSW52_05910 [Candidatus Coatesbacteria bacterium]|nr:MAG: hypothetical protein JSW52_05910 [Candidatus Coatesbacteria bacterium]